MIVKLNNRDRRSGRRGAGRFMLGQAMTEFNVSVAFVFLPLFVLVPTLGKLIDMQHQNQLAARYAAWERTVWFDNIRGANRDDFVISSKQWESVAQRSEGEIKNSLTNRFFLNVQSGGEFTNILDTDASAASNEAPGLWDYVQSKNSMYGGTSLERFSYSDVENTPSLAYDILGFINSGLSFLMKPMNSILAFLGNDNEDFLTVAWLSDQRTYYRPIVKTQLNIRGAHGNGTSFWDRKEGQDFTPGIESALFHSTPNKVSEERGSWDGVLESRSAIIADGWSAQSEAHYVDRVDDWVMSSVLDLGPVRMATDIAAIFEGGKANSAIGRFQFGAVGTKPMPVNEDGEPLEVECEDGLCGFAD